MALFASAAAWAGPRDFVVYAPGMGGTPEQAKPYLEQFFRYVEKPLGWPSGSAGGQYLDDPKQAQAYIASGKPGWGMLKPGLLLKLSCGKDAPVPLADAVGIGGAGANDRYYVVVKGDGVKSLDDLKGKKLASNHLHDVDFVTRVVFAGKIDAASYFQLQPTPSPVKPLKAVDRGEADAALIDEAQLKNAKTLPFGASLKVIYTSEPLPPFPVVAFPSVTRPADRDAMKKALTGMCASKEGAAVCQALGISDFKPLDPSAYQAAVKQYCKP